ncbi:hypothetical protein LF845_01350 [Deferribacterales bacterium Es71-Z0220]|uniref:hypothetical protein n=1 Tax=Deferrivibrio essentukiensis TaxID=2880922 RepID=UPI001F625346|nr:hypothetical protein [Deferrivibrio essentukiensis]MCB4203601.1 hypothetical protein [Deferrivibrio essentukiensis]
MKKIIGISLIIGIFAALFLYLKFDESYKLYYEAEKLYKEGNINQAYEKIKEAVEVNHFNKKVLILKAKLYKIVSNNEKLEKAEKYYTESKKAFFVEDYEKAKILISKAYELTLSIPESAHNKKEALTLQKKIEKDITRIQSVEPSVYYQRALKLAEKNDYIAAFELLNKLNTNDEKLLSLKSDFAFKIGTSRYTSILKKQNPSETEILDAIYWLNNVDKKNTNYKTAEKYIQVLKNYLGR